VSRLVTSYALCMRVVLCMLRVDAGWKLELLGSLVVELTNHLLY
jgi:hypothetical protein